MAIITTTEYKAYRGISDTAFDAVLAVLIPAVQERVEDYCSRKFDSASYTENISGDGSQTLITKHWPITAITSITVVSGSTSTILTAATDYKASEALAATIYRMPFNGSIGFGGISEWGDPIRGGVISPRWVEGHENIEVQYTGGYTSGTMPASLKLTMYELVDEELDRRGDSWRAAAVGEGAETKTMRAAPDIAQRWRDMLAPYRRLP